MLFLITLPFIMVTDLFPFMRFGMFAEPVKYQVQQEYFEIVVTDRNQKATPLDPLSVGIEKHFFEYIARNYYYRGEGKLLLEKIGSLAGNQAQKLELNRYNDYRDKKSVPDTSITVYLK
jgi:hypothetical protein